MIGIYGGTFDPVHYGHLRTALEVKELLQLQEVRLLLSAQPPHRQPPLASPEQRRQMLSLALAGNDQLFIDDRELRRPGPSYMIDTLRSLRQDIPAKPLLLFIGSDAFAHLTAWRDWQGLFHYAHIVVMQRPGISGQEQSIDPLLNQRITRQRDDLQEHACGYLYFLNVTQLDISATQIRQAIAQQRSAQYLLPDSVLDYITHNRLYMAEPDE